MSSPIITVENLGKCYRIQHQPRERYTALRDVLTNKVKGLFRPQTSDLRPQTSEEDFWALKDVSFEIKQGEVVGIIGRNGAGKSTLLKILSRITEPTKGRITLRGRIASLLEVGTGFHPELTGRENIYLNGAILGMRREEIKAKFDEIVAFAEIEKFLDTPVKRYSSGMYVRLAFAVAAHLEPEILIVDEVLAVGDAQFQAKCLGKMQDVAKGGGRTVLFVSHNMAAVQSLCQRAIQLQAGKLIADGPSHPVVQSYLSSGGHQTAVREFSDFNSAPGTEGLRIKSARILAGISGNDHATISDEIAIEFELWCSQMPFTLNLSLVFWTSSRECAFNVASEARQVGPGTIRSICRIPPNLLNADTYSIDLYLVQDTSNVLHIEKDFLAFEAHEGVRNVQWYGKWIGAVRPQMPFSIESSAP